MTTKDRIIYEALSLFSMRGYEAVTIRQIATAVGIKESSVYNHFENKQDILDTIVRETINRYEKVLQESNVPGIEDPDVSGSFDSICDEDFYQMCTGVFLFYLKDEYISKLRRLLTIEQYSNPELGKTFKNIFINNILENQAKVLRKFIDSGRFIPGDAYTMALHFYAPVFLLLYKYDNNHENEEQAIAELRSHVSQYNALYKADHKIMV